MKNILLTMGKNAIVDDIDYDFISQFKWRTSRTNRGYGVREIWNHGNRYTEHLHRVILERKLGRKLSKKEQVDHIDGDGLNNVRENLRLSNQSQNMANSNMRSDNSTGVRGVHFNKSKNRFEVYINKNRKRYRLGRYKTLEEATRIRKKAENRYFGEFKHNDIARISF